MTYRHHNMGGALSNYKDILGVPRQGVHAARGIGDMARNDIIATVVFAASVSFLFGKRPICVFAGLCIAAVILHEVFGVHTVSGDYIFGRGR